MSLFLNGVKGDRLSVVLVGNEHQKTSTRKRAPEYSLQTSTRFNIFGTMSEKYKVIDSTIPTFITITVVDWVDLFIRPIYCNILDESLNYCIREKGLKVYAYVYMTSHIHLIVTAQDGQLQNIIRDFKKFTSKRLIEAIKEYPESRRMWLLEKFNYEAQRTGRAINYKLWRDGFHPVILDTLLKIKQRVNYIHNNPVKAEIVFHQRDYVNSSYRNYEEDNSVFCNVNIETLW